MFAAIARLRAALRRPSIPRTLLLQAGAGVALGLLATGALLLSDAFGLHRLLNESADLGALAIFLFAGGMTLAPLFVATAIGLLAEADEPQTQRARLRPARARNRTP